MTASTKPAGHHSVQDALRCGDPSQPTTERGWTKKLRAERWFETGLAVRVGKVWYFPLALFPASTQALLQLAKRDALQNGAAPRRSPLWQRYDALPDAHKKTCAERLTAVTAAHSLMATGMTLMAAVAVAASNVGVSSSTLRNWLKMVKGHNRADWLAALAPDYKPTAKFAECHPDAWAALKSDYLRPGEPGFSACYRRMVAAAAREGWSPIPSEMALRRRLAAEVPAAVATLARKGADKAKAIYPAQRRSRLKLRAMSVVNIDGHRFDVFVRRGDGAPFRPMLVAIQDVYSGKFLAWRLDESESRVPVRLAIGDMVERYGIPEHMVLDNGRSFASKWITGGTANRFRFKVRDDEPDGLLTQLGVQIHWALPFHGQAKPIERAFRDFCEDIARHPFCAGAYTGNSPLAKPEDYGSRAVEWEAFRQFVDGQIAEHNARPGRRAENAAGRSFDETFAASLADPSTIVRWPTSAQRSLWLLAGERIRASKGNGELRLFGNRYWNEALTAHAGREVTVRFDPDRLTRDLQVYDRNDRLICAAHCIADTGFDDVEAARAHAARRNRFIRTNRELQRQHAELTADELARLYAHGDPERPQPQRPKIARIAVAGGTAAATAEPGAWNEDAEAGFSRGLRLVAGSREDM